MANSIHFLITGGTIDSHFNPSTDKVEIGTRTDIPEYILKLKLNSKCEFTTLFLKDSREINHKDRKKLLDAVQTSEHTMLIITHGTYTMPDSAQYLKEQLGKTDKTIVFMGSMIPLTGFETSDAPFNLGFSVASVQTLPSGVYICMNGKVFDPEKVDKNRAEARFEETKE